MGRRPECEGWRHGAELETGGEREVVGGGGGVRGDGAGSGREDGDRVGVGMGGIVSEGDGARGATDDSPRTLKQDILMRAQAHDPVKTLDELRNHLALHDKPIAFLFGAGTSSSVRVDDIPLIPTVKGMTAECRNGAQASGDKYARAWDSIAAQCREDNIEDILTRLCTMIAAMSESDELSGLNREQVKKLDRITREGIARIVAPDISTISDDFPHRQFARWISRSSHRRPVEVFTVNYDVLIEHGMEMERVPLHDGFVGSHQPFFFPESLRDPEAQPGATWSRLWKMHGSVAWRRVAHGHRSIIVRGGTTGDGEMIYPSFEKYDESRQQPYVAFRDRLIWFLDQQDAVLIVCGFSFSDEHINDLMFTALKNRPRTHIYALQFTEELADSDLVRQASRHRNLIVIGPQTGVLSGRHAPWHSSAVPAVLSNVIKSSGTSDASTRVEVRIGDFAVFCRFIESITERK